MALPNVGEVFQNFKIIDDLGSGGMGHVYLAEDIGLRRKVALKFLGLGNEKVKESMLRRFEREARVLASFNHPNIVNIYSIGKHDGFSFIVMEYVQGSHLGDVIESGGLALNQTTHVIGQILDGMNEAHNKGILHRDIKPENILIDSDNKVKIVDFGICKNMSDESERITKENLILGTISYMAPEVIQFETPSEAADIFSLGVVFFELVTGSHPFRGSAAASRMYRICNEEIKFPRSWYDHVPSGMPEVIEKMTALKVKNRYQSANEVLQDLQNLSNVVLPSFRSVELESDAAFSDTNEAQKSLLMGGYDIDEAERIIEMAQQMEEDKESSEMEMQVARIMKGTEENRIERTTEVIEHSSYLSKKTIQLAKENYEKSRKKIVMPQFKKKGSNFDLQTILKPLIEHPKLTFLGLVMLLGLVFWSQRDPIKPMIAVSNINIFKNFVGELKRTMASIPDKPVEPLKKGNVIKIQRFRENINTGKRFLDVVDEMTIVSASGDIVFSKLKDGETKVESTLQFAKNPFLPPLRKVAKGQFDIKNVIAGSAKDIFPLEVGKGFNIYYTQTNRQSQYQYARNCEVKSREMIQDTEVFQVNCTTRGNHFEEKAEIFYSPEHNLILREVRTVNKQGQSFKETQQVIGI